MKTTCAVILSVLLLLVCACAQRVNDPADVQAIKKSVDDFAKALNARDSDGIAALMTDRAIFADNHFPVATGKEAIRSFFQAVFSQFEPDFGVVVEDVRVAGDVAVARGTWTMKLTPKAEGVAPSSEGGSWILASVRQNDGSWKSDWLVPNSNQPLPGSTASGEDEQALFQIEREWSEAAIKKDAAALDKILADDFVGHDASGARTKKQTLSSLRSDPTQIESGALSDMKAVVFGDTAVVHGLWIEKSSSKGKDTSGQYRWTDTFKKRDGRWQCVGSYSTKVE
jgi:uncharacterized protein (TIGR02246 family)